MNAFRREIDPPAALEERVIASLRERNLIAPVWRRWLGVAAGLAAAIVLFAGGYLAGARLTPPPATADEPNPRFALLLHETPATRSTGVPESQLVDEYRNWARSLASGGTRVQGEKLKMEGDTTLSGFFIIAAPSRDAAEAIAASCPHARYGGRIEVREIDPT